MPPQSGMEGEAAQRYTLEMIAYLAGAAGGKDAQSILDDDEGAGATFELPDGTMVSLDATMCNLPEMVMDPSTTLNMAKQSNSLARDWSQSSVSASAVFGEPQDLSLPQLVHRALLESDGDARKEMAGNIVLTGGASLFPGFPERLASEVTRLLPTAFRVKVLAATPVERRFGVWIGGSILCSLGTFQQMWVSKQEYEEKGPFVAYERFG